MLIGPKALPKTLPEWPAELMNIFVIRGRGRGRSPGRWGHEQVDKKVDLSNHSAHLDAILKDIDLSQSTLASQLESMAPNRRQGLVLQPRLDKEGHPRVDNAGNPLLPLLPVITKIEVLLDNISLIQSPESLKTDPLDPISHHQPLMSEDGRLIRPSDNSDSRPSSAFGSRNSSSQHPSPRESIDLQVYQGPAAFVQFQLQTRDELISLCGGGDHLPVHPSIGALHSNLIHEIIVYLKFCRYFAYEAAVFRRKYNEAEENEYASCHNLNGGYRSRLFRRGPSRRVKSFR